MRVLPLLMILCVFLSIGHASAMAVGHVASESERHVTTLDNNFGAEAHCCAEHSDQSPDCHIFAGLLPSLAKGAPMIEKSSGVLAEYGIVPDGIEPAGPLDPPRRS